jgi:peptidoglycan hydrolase-like protein with peptidoglycan-binding domain
MFTTLKLDSTGENVRHLQSFLKLKVDGDFGSNTEKAVKEWQK